MKWTDKVPTVPGFYFWRHDKDSGMAVVLVQHLAFGWWVDGGTVGESTLETWPKTSQWAGPIEEPI